MIEREEITEMKIKIKKLSTDAIIPEYKHTGDAGFDIAAAEDVIVERGETVKVRTGLAFDIPQGYMMQIVPRSGLTAKTPLRVATGTIDSGYRGEVSIICELRAYSKVTQSVPVESYFNSEGAQDITSTVPTSDYEIHCGDRIAQGIIIPVGHAEFEQVDELGDSERGVQGFGSTGIGSDEHD